MSASTASALRQQLLAERDDLRARLEQPALAQPGSVTARILRRQTENRVAALELELAVAESEQFEMAFVDVEEPRAHNLSTTLLSNLLSRFQRAVTYSGWARLAGPGVAGTIPSLVARTFETRVNALAPGSFVVNLSPHEAALEHDALDDALSDFLDVARLGLVDDLNQASESLAAVTQELGKEATTRLALFFAKLHEARLEARFAWANDPTRQVTMAPEQAATLSAWLKQVEEEFVTIPVRGVLTAADTTAGRFAITEPTGEVTEGKAAPELLSRAIIDAPYQAQVRVTRSRSVATGAVSARAVLESLEPLDDDA